MDENDVTLPELAERLNHAPIVYRGCTGSAIAAALSLTVFVGIAAGLGLAMTLHLYVGVLGFVGCSCIVFFTVVNKIAYYKEHRPEGYLVIRLTVKASKIMPRKPGGTIVDGKRWSVGRSI